MKKSKGIDGCAHKGKTKGRMVGYKAGGAVKGREKANAKGVAGMDKGMANKAAGMARRPSGRGR